MPVPIKNQTETPYPALKELVFPQDAERLKADPTYTPCKMFIRGELLDPQYDQIEVATGDFRPVADGFIPIQNPFKIPSACLDVVFSDGGNKWNLTDDEGDPIPFTREEFNKLPKRDRLGWTERVADPDKPGQFVSERHEGLKVMIANWYTPQIMDLNTADPTDEQLESPNPNSESPPDATPSGDDYSVNSPEAETPVSPEMIGPPA